MEEINQNLKCKFCRSGLIKNSRTVRSPHNAHLYSLVKCNNCQSLFFPYNKSSDIYLSKLYEELAKRNRPKYTSKFRRNNYWENQTRLITKLLGRTPTGVLDVGCGSGKFLMHWGRDVDAEGVELSSQSAKIAEDRGIRIFNGFFEDIKFSKCYDVVTCYAFIEHLIEPMFCLNKLTKITDIDGMLVIMIPTYQSLKRWLIDTFTSIRWHMYSPPEHLNFYSKKFLDSYLSNKGFYLKYRYWTSGGIFNPFQKIPFVSTIFAKSMYCLDERSPINKMPIFDHMYSYYIHSQD